jgi:hypothetical protein
MRHFLIGEQPNLLGCIFIPPKDAVCAAIFHAQSDQSGFKFRGSTFRSARREKWTLQRFFKRAPRSKSEQSCLHNELSAFCLAGAGSIATSEWRNQNQLDYSMISRRIWKKG